MITMDGYGGLHKPLRRTTDRRVGATMCARLPAPPPSVANALLKSHLTSLPIDAQVAARMGCTKAATTCGAPGAPACKAACTSLVGVAQALGMAPGLVGSMFHASFQQTRLLPCDAQCTKLDKLQGRCPAHDDE